MNIIYATCVLTLLSLSANAQTKNFIDQPYLEVNGSADTLITPDEIFISIMISEKDSKDRVSVEEQEAKMVAALSALGIEVEKNLSASYMGSNFKFYLLKGKDVIKTKQYVLKVGGSETASKVFLQLEQLGISNSSIQRVNHSSIDKLRNSMRSRAVENAKDRANALLQPLHQNVGPAIHIADNENYNLTNQVYGSSLQEVVVTGYALRGRGEGLYSKIDFEKIKVAASVNVKFGIK
jgi:uncharacterized protein YggE